jgi:hypothetical protein
MTVVIFLVSFAGLTLFLNAALYTFGITEIGIYVFEPILKVFIYPSFSFSIALLVSTYLGAGLTGIYVTPSTVIGLTCLP